MSTGWTYDVYGNILTQTSARGFTTTIAYDATQTFPATLTSPPAGTPAAQLVTTYTYDTGLGVLQGVIDPNGQPTNYQYDAFGRLTAITNALNETTTVAYENLGTVGSQKTTVRVPDGTGGNIWRSNYFDGLGRTFKVEREGASGTVIVESVEYDARGLVSTVSLPRFSTDTEYRTTHTYDPLGRLTLRLLPDNASESWAYNDWTTTYTNPRGFSWVYVADAYGRIERVREPVEAGGTPPETAYTYDPVDRLRGVTDALGRPTTLQYDTLGRRTALTDPTLGFWSYQYDVNGNLVARTDAKGQGVTFQYDGLDRLVQKTYPDGRRIEFEYRNDQDPAMHARGRLRRAVDYTSAGTLSVAKEYEYDKLGRVTALTRVIDNLSYRSELTYTPFSAFKTVRYPDGEVLTYTYDAAGQVSQVVGVQDIPRTYLESATYNAAGKPTQLQRYGGVVTDFTYSPTRQWLTAVRSSASTATLQDLVFGRDAVGNITSLTNNVDRLLDQTFDDYDPLDRLRRAVGPYGTHTYTYDAVGNLLGKAGVTYAYGATAVGCGRSIPYAVTSTSSGFSGTYDCNGNLLGDGERSFVWDPDDRPTSITHAAHGTTAFQYGPDGERMRKATSTKTVRYAGWLEDRVEDNVIVKHVYAGGRRIATRLSSAGPESDVYVPLDNQIGSLHALVRGGQVVLTPGYLPFGESDPAHTTGSADWYQHRFTGQEQDPETELYYYGARYYNPKLGRFVSPDPIVTDPHNPQGLNRWSYVRNNPLRFTDPTGLDCCASDDEGARNEEGGYGESHGSFDIGSADGGPTGMPAMPVYLPDLKPMWGPEPDYPMVAATSDLAVILSLPGSSSWRSFFGTRPARRQGWATVPGDASDPGDASGVSAGPGAETVASGGPAVGVQWGVAGTIPLHVSLVGPFVSGSVVVGANTRGQFFGTAQLNVYLGVGSFAGWGFQVPVSVSSSALPGRSTDFGFYGEANSGFGPGAFGVSAQASATSAGATMSAPKRLGGRKGVGYGLNAGVGFYGSFTLASPPLW